jgi:hypothetical protein
MIDYPNLLAECNVNTVFVEMLGYKNPNHSPDISHISSTLIGGKLKGAIIGFIDDDKRKPSYFSEFDLFDKVNDASLLKHPDRSHYLVVFNPAMDGFIYNLSRYLNVDLPHYKLPGAFEPFMSMTKKEAIRRNSDFKNMLNTIIQKRPIEITKIKSWVSKYSPYKN